MIAYSRSLYNAVSRRNNNRHHHASCDSNDTENRLYTVKNEKHNTVNNMSSNNVDDDTCHKRYRVSDIVMFSQKRVNPHHVNTLKRVVQRIISQKSRYMTIDIRNYQNELTARSSNSTAYHTHRNCDVLYKNIMRQNSNTLIISPHNIADMSRVLSVILMTLPI